ncbi:hypothetical protein [Bacillus sp. ISL-7]|uniref:hypothetical protein n=1 Tax=Bacillus sp. ISL-7 TaxID=2819136 RepID=UPI001BEBB840|nr:hypothetical protein [Bacillus sp. ISL-7]MBT2736166.1 hypothetical protein [Bacillus sp. ISL-7]
MEKTILIDGKQVPFKSTGALPLRYKMQFGKDFFKEFLKLIPQDKLNNVQDGRLKAEDIQDLDFELFYNITWVLAKTADPSIPDLLTWLDSFEEFPIGDIIEETQDLLMKSLQQSKKK